MITQVSILARRREGGAWVPTLSWETNRQCSFWRRDSWFLLQVWPLGGWPYINGCPRASMNNTRVFTDAFYLTAGLLYIWKDVTNYGHQIACPIICLNNNMQGFVFSVKTTSMGFMHVLICKRTIWGPRGSFVRLNWRMALPGDVARLMNKHQALSSVTSSEREAKMLLMSGGQLTAASGLLF